MKGGKIDMKSLKKNICAASGRAVAILLTLIICLSSFSATVVAEANNEGEIDMNDCVLCDFEDKSSYASASGYSGVSFSDSYHGNPYFSALSGSTTDTVNAVVGRMNPPVDVSSVPVDELYLSINMYFENPAVITGGQIELTSSGTCDVEELGFSIGPDMLGICTIKPGWNRFLLPLTSGNQGAVGCELSQMDYFRIYFRTSASIKVGMSDMRLIRISQYDLDENFTDEAVLSGWGAEGAELRISEDGLNITMTAGEATVRTSAYSIANAIPEQLILRVGFTGGDAVGSASLSVGRGNRTAEYDIVPANGVCLVGMTDYNRASSDFIDFTDADTVALRLSAPAGTEICLTSLAIIEESTVVVEKIAAVGEITFDNLAQKQALLDEATSWVERYQEKVSVYYITRTVYNYYVYLNAVAAADKYSRAAKSGMLTELELTVAAVSAGDGVTLRLQLTNLTDKLMAGYSVAVETKGTGLVLYTSAEGVFNLSAGETQTRDLILHTDTGGLYTVTATIRDPLGATVTVETYTFTVVGRGYYLGDSHTHSVGSDGKYTIADNARAAYLNGSLVLYATDHNANPSDRGDLEEARRALAAGGYGDMILLKGNEITSFVTGAGHLLHYITPTYYPAPSSKNNDENGARYSEIMDAIMAEGGACYIAHPYLTDWPFYGISQSPSNIDVYTNFTGVEIFNGRQNTGSFDMSEKAIEYWDRMNLKGDRKYFAIGNSDAHHVANMNGSSSVFLLPELTEREYNNALLIGSSYVTDGPWLTFDINGTDMGGSVIVDGSAEGTVRASATHDASPLTEVRLVKYSLNENNDAGYATRETTVLFSDKSGATGTHSFEKTLTVTLRDGEFYRLEVDTVNIGSAILAARSNPIWITHAAASINADESVALKAGESAVISASTDNIYDSLIFTSSDPSAITVLDNGRVTAATGANGEYKVNITSTSGAVNATVTVTVEGTEGGDTVKLTADMRMGEAVDSFVQYVKSGECALSPNAPEREGFAFCGWYDAPTGGSPFDFCVPVTRDTTVYARWEQTVSADSLTVRIDLAGGSANYATVFKVSSGEKFTEPAKPVRDGFRFLGFFTEQEDGERYNFSSNLRDDLVLYAHWAPGSDEGSSPWIWVTAAALAVAGVCVAALLLRRRVKKNK